MIIIIIIIMIIILITTCRLEGVKQLCRMIKADDCCLETLDLSDSKLRELTSAILNSLIYNDSIIKLDVRYAL